MGETRKLCSLQYPAGAVVIFCVTLLLAVSGGAHPLQIFGKPALDSCCAFENSGVSQDGRGAGGLDKMQRVNNADATSVIQMEDRLRVFEIRAHFRGRIDKPRSKMFA